MPLNDPSDPYDNRPRVEPEIIPPRAQSRQRGFDSLFLRVEEGDDGIKRIQFKRPGPFTIVLMLLAAGVAVALSFVVLSALVLLCIPLVIVGIAFAMFSGSAQNTWQRIQGWFGRFR